MEYKVLIFGNGLNKEVEIGEATRLSIGTDKRCQIWLKGEIFPYDFIIKMDIADGGYRLEVPELIEIKDASVGERIPLSQSVTLGYKDSEKELFSLQVAADFTNQTLDYHMAIGLADLPLVTIGTDENSDIRIKNEDLPGIKLSLKKQADGFEAEAKEGAVFITHNGANIREDSFTLKNNDFIGVANIQFFYSDGKLYTEDRDELICRLATDVISEQNNKLKYPEFIRNVRLQFKQPAEKLEVLQPSNQPQEPEGNLLGKLLPMLIMMIMMTVLRVMIRSNIVYALYFVVMMGMSSVMTAINFVGAKKKYKEKSEHRQKVYNDYIEKKDKEIIEKRSDEKLIAQKMCVLPTEAVEQIQNFDARLFEKLKDHDDFLDVPIGTGTVDSSNQIVYKAQEYVETEDPLLTIPENIHDKYQKLTDMPIVLHLAKVNAIGVLGTRNKLYQMMKNIMISLAAQHFYQDVKFYVMLNKEDVQYFTWMRWLRNLNENGRRNILYDEGSKKTILEAIYNELSSREGMKKEELKSVPHYIVFAYRSENMSGHPITKYVERANELGFTFIFFEEYKELMHEACDELVCLDRETNSGFIQKTDDAVCVQQFTYPRVDKESISAAALKLACVHVNEISLESTLTKNITLYQLLKVMNAYDLNIGMRWANSNIYESMAAALGVDSSGQTVYLDIHEKAHGPHGLVAGTTGSGKSEILQSYVLSMCLNFHPYEVGFVIIDFKGGGMANQFKDLPHLNGAITNIDGKQIDRSLMSIKAELMKRQKLFAEYSVNKIDDYIELYKTGVAKIPLPHLVLIVDEFAELKSDQPEFMKELISAARIGRSLGMHLILATQKPAGVVNDQIWSNSRFKLCLKVQDKSDSKEVLKSPLAAEIREPGRAYMQVGNNEIFQLFQSAYSGAPVNVEQMEQQKQFDINVVDFAGRRQPVYSQKPQKEKRGGETQLDAIVGYIQEYCNEHGIERLPDICLPALEEYIKYPKVERTDETDVILPIGIYDNPAGQEQAELTVNLTRNNYYIVGGTQTGKTNLLQVIIRGLCEKYGAEDVSIYIADFASMLLKSFENLNQVGGVVTLSEDTKLKQLMDILMNELYRRKQILSENGLSSFAAYREAGYKDLKQIVFVIENYAMFHSVYAEYDAMFNDLCRDSVAVGISVVMTNALSSGLGMKLQTYFGGKISFHQNDTTQYNVIFEHCKLYPDDLPGRAVIKNKDGLMEFQSYVAFDAEKEIERVEEIREFVSAQNAMNKNSYAEMIPTIPEVVTEGYLLNQYKYSEEIFDRYSVPIGLRYEDIKPEFISLLNDNFIGMLGQDDLGRLAFIKYVLRHLDSYAKTMPVELYVIDGVGRELEEISQLSITKQYTTNQKDVEGIISNAFETAKARFAALSKGSVKMDEEPLIILLFNSNLTEEILALSQASIQRHEMLIRKLKGCKVCIMHTQINNSPVTFSSSSVARLITEECKVIAFENVKAIKPFAPPQGASRKYAKKMEFGDAFYINNGIYQKIRVTTKN